MTLRLYPDPILKMPTEPVAPGADVRQLIANMKIAVHGHLGLSAQQVGRTERVAIITLGGKLVAAINLDIVQRSRANITSAHEGCLSVRLGGRIFRMNVKRSARVKARWIDEEGHEEFRWLGGMEAIIAQHEAEHLDGKCIVDRLAPEQLDRLTAVATPPPAGDQYYGGELD